MSRSQCGSLSLVTLLLLALGVPPLRAQLRADDYAARRAALTTRIDSGIVLAFGAPETVSHWPSFFQLPAFYYLTGFSESDAVLVMVKRGGKVTATMFVPTLSPSSV